MRRGREGRTFKNHLRCSCFVRLWRGSLRDPFGPSEAILETFGILAALGDRDGVWEVSPELLWDLLGP